MNISPNVHILTTEDLNEIKDKAFESGVQRGRFEERLVISNSKAAINCANWKDGICHKCGVQSQFCEVDKTHKCAYFEPRAGK